MNIIACLDDKNGILFNKRRQSSDKALCEHIIKLCGENRLLMNEYSAKLFESGNIVIDNDFLQKAQNGDYCFIENSDIEQFLEKAETIIIYRWNRAYPSDKKIPLERLLQNRKLISSKDFKGNSHEKITEEIYGL